MAFLASMLPMLGGLLGGLTGGGGDEKKGGGGGGAAAAPPAPSGPVVPGGPTIVGGGGGSGDATTLAALAGSLAGGAMGNPAAGLAAPVLAQTLSGRPANISQGLTPPQAAALETFTAREMNSGLRQHSEQVGRAQVQRTVDAVHPALTSIQSQLHTQAMQTQATAEHRLRVEEEKFREDVRKSLGKILSDLADHHKFAVKRSKRIRTY